MAKVFHYFISSRLEGECHFTAAANRISAANSEGLFRIAENTVSGKSVVMATDIVPPSLFS